MVQKNSIKNFADAVRKNVGNNISLYLKKGRKSIIVTDCIIESAYDSIFVVRILGESLINTKRISVSYADLLTGNARITVAGKVKPA